MKKFIIFSLFFSLLTLSACGSTNSTNGQTNSITDTVNIPTTNTKPRPDSTLWLLPTCSHCRNFWLKNQEKLSSETHLQVIVLGQPKSADEKLAQSYSSAPSQEWLEEWFKNQNKEQIIKKYPITQTGKEKALKDWNEVIKLKLFSMPAIMIQGSNLVVAERADKRDINKLLKEAR